MTPKVRIHPIWILGNSMLAETINPCLSTDMVSYIQDAMGWVLSDVTNDALWEGLADVGSYHKD